MQSIRDKELKYYKHNQIALRTVPQCFDISDLNNRKSEIFFEPFNQRPQDIFFLF